MWEFIRRQFRRTLLSPIRSLLTQGATPEKVALCVGIGLAIAVCPILGVATLLCTLMAAVLRLNLPLIQGVNYLAAPLQFALILPYIRAGEWLFRAGPMPFSIPELFRRFEADWAGFISDFWLTGIMAGTAWLLTVPLITGTVYVLLLPSLRRIRP